MEIGEIVSSEREEGKGTVVAKRWFVHHTAADCGSRFNHLVFGLITIKTRTRKSSLGRCELGARYQQAGVRPRPERRSTEQVETIVFVARANEK